MFNAQEWLDKNYPKEIRENIKELDLTDKKLRGILDLLDFVYLEKLNISGNPHLDEIKNRRRQTGIYVRAQEWLNKLCPYQEIKVKIRKIDVSRKWSGTSEIMNGKLDLREFVDLEELYCSGGNQITELNLSNCPKLKILDCSNNQLTSLDLSNNPLLEEINCTASKINEINLTNCHNLKKIECRYNKLTELCLESLTNLIYLECSENQISELDLSNCLNLENFVCVFGKEGGLKKLIVSKLKKLRKLNCNGNQLRELDVDGCSSLKELWCNNNLLTGLSLINNLKLETLDVHNNNFSKQNLDFLSHLLELKKLYLGNQDFDERIDQKIYNRFTGSLNHLENMKSLNELDIASTDIDSGLENLSDNLKEINCWGTKRKEAKVKEIEKNLKNYKIGSSTHGFSYDFQEWKKAYLTIKKLTSFGLRPEDTDFVSYLEEREYVGEWNLENTHFKKLKEDYIIEKAEVSKRWKGVHPDFTEKLVKKWECRTTSEKEIKEWISIGLTPQEYKLASYLGDYEHEPKEILKKYDLVELKDKYRNYLVNWRPIHKDFEGYFGIKYQKQWEELGFSCEEVKRWINIGFKPDQSFSAERWKEKNFTTQEVCQWTNCGLEVNEEDIAYYSKKKKYNPLNFNGKELRKEFYNAQNWLDYFYPLEKRKKIISLYINNKRIEGSLIIEKFPSLEKINCSNNQLNSLKLIDLPRIIELDCYINKLVELKISRCPIISKISAGNNNLINLQFLDNLNCDKLIDLHIPDNDFEPCSISYFSKFSNLESLCLGYGRQFYGSLESMKKLTKFNSLIWNKDIDNRIDLEYFPISLDKIRSWATGPRSHLNVSRELESYRSWNYLYFFDLKKWREDQEAFWLLKRSLEKVNQSLNVWEFLGKQNIFFNVKTGSFEGNAEVLISFFQQAKIIESLEDKLERLLKLVKFQREKITKAYLHFFPNCPEKELLRKLIEIYVELRRNKKSYSAEYGKLRGELENKLSEEHKKNLEIIIKDCEDLVITELELATKFNLKVVGYNEEGKAIINIITGNINVQGGHALIGCDMGNNLNLSQNTHYNSQGHMFNGSVTTGSNSNFSNKFITYKSKRPRRESWEENDLLKKTKGDWTNIHQNFSNQQLVREWLRNSFPYQQTQEWANAFGQQFNPQGVDFYVWLRDIKELTPEECLNNHNLAELKAEYQDQHLQTQIQVTPK